MSVANNWKNIKIGVRIKTSNTTASHAPDGIELSIPSRIMIREAVTYDIVDGINKYNQGVIAKPHRYTFAVSVPVNTDTARLLRALLADEEPFVFDIIDVDPIANTFGEGTQIEDFRILGERLIDCYLTDKEITVEVGALPYAVFNGIALGYDPKILIETEHNIQWLSDVAKGLYYGASIPSDLTSLKAVSILDKWRDSAPP